MAEGIGAPIQTGSVQGISPELADQPASLPQSGKFSRFTVSRLPPEQIQSHVASQSPDTVPGSQKGLDEFASLEVVEGQSIVGTEPEAMSPAEIKQKTKSLKGDRKAFKKTSKKWKVVQKNATKKLSRQKTGLGGKEGKTQQKAQYAQIRVKHLEQLQTDVIRYKTAETRQDQEVSARTDQSQDKKTLKAAASYHKEHKQLAQLEGKLSKKLATARKKQVTAEKSIKSAHRQDIKDIKKAKQQAKAREQKLEKALKQKETQENKALTKQQKILNKNDSTLRSPQKTGAQKTAKTAKTAGESSQAIAQRTYDGLKKLIAKAPTFQQAAKLESQIKNNSLITPQQRNQLAGILEHKLSSFLPEPPRKPPG